MYGKSWKAAKIQRFPEQDLAVVTLEEGQNCPYQVKLGNSDRVQREDRLYISGKSQDIATAKALTPSIFESSFLAIAASNVEPSAAGTFTWRLSGLPR
jgi:hypothetical protein